MRRSKAAQLADAVIYPVVVMPITNDAGRNIGGEHALQFMAEGTGGRTFLPSSARRWTRLSPTSSPNCAPSICWPSTRTTCPLTKDPFHKLEVRVGRPELRVSARNGYYGEAEGAAGTPDARIPVDPEGQKKRQKK